MRLPKTHSHTSERLGYKARKNVKEVIEINADTIRWKNIRQNLPRTASVAGGARRQGAMARPTTVIILPRIVSVAGGRETTKGELKENTGSKTRETKVTLPQATIVAGEGETKGENQHEMGRWHNPQSREGGRCLAKNAYHTKKQNNVHHKESKRKHTVLCHCVSSQITLAAPRLVAEEGVGRTTKETNTKNLQSHAPV